MKIGLPCTTKVSEGQPLQVSHQQLMMGRASCFHVAGQVDPTFPAGPRRLGGPREGRRARHVQHLELALGREVPSVFNIVDDVPQNAQ